MEESVTLPQYAINRIFDSISIPERTITETEPSFPYRPAAEAFLESQPTSLTSVPSYSRPGQTLETSKVFPLVTNYSGGARPPPTPAESARTHTTTCSHVECLHFRQVIKRANYNATTSLASTRVNNLLVLD